MSESASLSTVADERPGVQPDWGVRPPNDGREAEFHRKHRYVRYMQREGMDSADELFGFLADLRNDEAATVERIRRTMADDD